MRTTSTGELVYAAHYPLPGEVQTVARGELLALVVLLRFATPLAEIDFVTDNKGVFDKYNSGPKKAKLSSNCDLYHELFQLIFKKCLFVTVRWMPSHLSPEDPRPLGVSEVDVKVMIGLINMQRWQQKLSKCLRKLHRTVSIITSL